MEILHLIFLSYYTKLTNHGFYTKHHHWFHLQKDSLLISLKKINFDQKIKLLEPNRRALNLLLDLKNRQITTITLLKACLFREESRGGHYRDDFPDKDKDWECHTRQQLDHKIQKRFIKN